MQTVLKEKLQAYIIMHNPELMLGLQAGHTVTQYLEDRISAAMPLVMQLLEQGKPGYVIEELALHQMTTPLRPSKFHYLKKVLEIEFTSSYNEFRVAGVLTYEGINLTEVCAGIFETFSFSEDNEDDRLLRYAVIARIHDYIN